MNSTFVDIIFWSSVFAFIVGSIVFGTFFFNEGKK